MRKLRTVPPMTKPNILNIDGKSIEQLIFGN